MEIAKNKGRARNSTLGCRSIDRCLLVIVSVFFLFVPPSSGAAQQSVQQITKIVDEHGVKLLEQEKRIAGVESKLDVIKDYAALSQKQVDWWIGMLSILATLFGLGIPIALAIKIRSDHRKNIREANAIAADSRKYLQEIQSHLAETRNTTAKNITEANAIAAESRRYLEEIQIHFTETKNTTAELKAAVARELEEAAKRGAASSQEAEASPLRARPTANESATVEEVLQNPKSDGPQKLLATAISFQNADDWIRAAGIWDALYALEPTAFNALRLSACLRLTARPKAMTDDALAESVLDRALTLVRPVLAAATNPVTQADAWFEIGATYTTKANRSADLTERKNLYSLAIDGLTKALTADLETGDKVFRTSYLAHAIGDFALLLPNPTEKKNNLLKAVELARSATALDETLSWPWMIQAFCYMGLSNMADSDDERNRWKKLSEEAEARRDALVEKKS